MLRDRNRDPRSPVQPDASNLPYFLAAIVAAVGLWAIQQSWTEDSAPEVEHTPPPAGSSSANTGDIRTVFSGDDYPAQAQARGEEGTVQARLSVDTDGRVSACTVIRSSGHSSLDSATCRILERRARFTPAHDSSGRPTTDTVVTPPITWRLEG
jgi:protein TonB